MVRKPVVYVCEGLILDLSMCGGLLIEYTMNYILKGGYYLLPNTHTHTHTYTHAHAQFAQYLHVYILVFVTCTCVK